MKKVYLFPKFSSKRIKPKNLVIDDEYLFLHEYEKKFPGVYYIETKNATVINKSVYSFRKLRLLTKYSYFYKPRKIRLFKDVVGNLSKSINKSAKIKSGILTGLPFVLTKTKRILASTIKSSPFVIN